MSTSRAIFSINYGVTYCYTLEASYTQYLGLNRETKLFTPYSFKSMGSTIADTFYDFNKVL